MGARELSSKIERAHSSVPSEELDEISWLAKPYLCGNRLHGEAGMRKQAFRFQYQALLYKRFG
jgi:hypothetical protein